MVILKHYQKNLDETKYNVPDGFLFVQARQLLRQPHGNNDRQQLHNKLKWSDRL